MMLTILTFRNGRTRKKKSSVCLYQRSNEFSTNPQKGLYSASGTAWQQKRKERENISRYVYIFHLQSIDVCTNAIERTRNVEITFVFSSTVSSRMILESISEYDVFNRLLF